MTSPLLRGEHAPAPRTLVDIVRATVSASPDAPALDNGRTVLTYAEFLDAATELAQSLAELGVSRGDKVGIRIASGSTDLYVAIMGILVAGAAYVPVDADDPDERARTVFDEAAVAAVIGNGLTIAPRVERAPVEVAEPGLQDDAWVIFTSGSTGKPKGVAVTHRNAAAFVDAEARLFCQGRPIGPGDRVMAGLSVAFDASCEEMWLAWRYGATLVPAPRSLVRSGMDLGPWLLSNDITVVSTVPTLVSLWPAEALDAVRLLILGGEACPPEIGARLATPGREVWNTYGPTEATVVACAAQLTGQPPVRIGLPLDGWDLAIVDGQGHPVPDGEEGELIIGGVGLARYLDPVKDAEKYAPMPTLGWQRAYRSGDLVRYDGHGLLFIGRADDQVKVGGRRIELGEIDSALLALPGVNGAAAAVRKTGSGNALIVGYVTADDGFDPTTASAQLRATMPAALVPRLAVVADLPTRTSGKIDRDALPWPLPAAPTAATDGVDLTLTPTQDWLRGLWAQILGATVTGLDDDFFDLGGGSLTAAQLVSRLRERFPEITVAHLYEQPTLGGMAAFLDDMGTSQTRVNRPVNPVPRKTQTGQLLATWGLRSLTGVRWVVWLAMACTLLHGLGLTWLPTASWWWIAAAAVIFLSAPGRMVLTAAAVRLILRGIGPGRYPRGGKIHLRIWLAERVADELGAASLSGAGMIRWYARALGAQIGRGVDLHSVPPVTGMLRLGREAAIEPEVDLTGHWLDGDVLVLGPIEVGAGTRVGSRSTLTPGTRIGKNAEIAPGSAVFGEVPSGEFWSGAPAERIAKARGPWHDQRPDNKPIWNAAYGATALLLGSLPGLAVALAVLPVWPLLRGADSAAAAARILAWWLVPGTLLAYLALAALIWVVVRLCGLGLRPGFHPVQGRVAWQAWTTMRVLDDARTWLFPLYSSSLTPAWLRFLGATVGRDVEASTVVMIPSLTTVAEGAFLADDTLIGGYELGGGWLRVEQVKVGKHAFVGNSGMAAPGRKVPKQGLVAVLSAAPRRAKAKAGTSWIGSPPEKLRRTGVVTADARTYAPTRELRVKRGLIEACRILPCLALSALGLGTVATLLVIAAAAGWWVAAVISGIVLMAAGLLGALLAVAAKWALVGRVEQCEHPLWSSFVWRNELADTFVEMIAAPWFARPAAGTPALNWWLRRLGARIGRGVWCETYWLPEPDLIDLRDGATVNRGCVVQTHLFHDRVLACDTVTVKAGGTLGPNSVILPAATIGRDVTIGPASLVMRGETVPDRTRWIGNPIGPWRPHDDEPALAGATAEEGTP